MNKNVNQKLVLVTGAAGGIGRATALDFARAGARLIITDINAPALAETDALIAGAGGQTAVVRAVDISNYQEVEKFRDEVRETCGFPDIVVNVAGIALFAQLEDTTIDDWRRILGVNLHGVIHVIDLFVKPLIEQRRPGHLINVASTAGLIGLPWHAAYSASKFGVVGLSEVLHHDLHKHGIDVSVVCPGAVNTPMTESTQIRGVPELVEKNRSRFQQVAIPPEAVSKQILKAVSTKEFMIITSADIKLLHGLKRHFPGGYKLVMQVFTRIMDSQLLGTGRPKSF